MPSQCEVIQWSSLPCSALPYRTTQEVEYLSAEDLQRGTVVNFGWPCYEGTMANEKNLAWLRYTPTHTIKAQRERHGHSETQPVTQALMRRRV